MEPVHVGHEQPIWMARALAEKWPHGAVRQLAGRQVGLDESHFDRWLTWQPSESEQGAEILGFNWSERSGQSSSRTGLT